jgi:hypothetical protein
MMVTYHIGGNLFHRIFHNAKVAGLGKNFYPVKLSATYVYTVVTGMIAHV